VRSRTFRVRSWVRVLPVVSVEAGAVTRGAWGERLGREMWLGVERWARGAHETGAGPTGFVSRLCLDGRTAEPTKEAATSLQHAIKNGVVTILSPRPRPLTSEGCVGKEGRTMGVSRLSPCTVYHLDPTSRPIARGEGTGAYHDGGTLSSPAASQY